MWYSILNTLDKVTSLKPLYANFSTELRWLLPYQCLHHFTVYVECFCINIYISAKSKSDAGVGLDILDLNIFEAWLVRILVMELLNHLRSIRKIGNKFPSPFAYFVILPINRIF